MTERVHTDNSAVIAAMQCRIDALEAELHDANAVITRGNDGFVRALNSLEASQRADRVALTVAEARAVAAEALVAGRDTQMDALRALLEERLALEEELYEVKLAAAGGEDADERAGFHNDAEGKRDA